MMMNNSMMLNDGEHHEMMLLLEHEAFDILNKVKHLLTEDEISTLRYLLGIN